MNAAEAKIAWEAAVAACDEACASYRAAERALKHKKSPANYAAFREASDVFEARSAAARDAQEAFQILAGREEREERAAARREAQPRQPELF